WPSHHACDPLLPPSAWRWPAADPRSGPATPGPFALTARSRLRCSSLRRRPAHALLPWERPGFPYHSREQRPRIVPVLPRELRAADSLGLLVRFFPATP